MKWVVLIVALALPAVAWADPCKAIPDRGPVPEWLKPKLRKGAAFEGPVTAVIDGDGLCVAVGKGPDTWVEVRVADFYAPELSAPGGKEAKAALERVTRGKRAICTAQHRSHDRVVAVCTINGRSVADLMRAQGIAEGGNGFRGGSQ